MDASLPYWFTMLFNILRYVLLGGMAFLSFYVLWPNFFTENKIQSRLARKKDFVRELSHSLQTIVIFIGMNLLVLYTPLRKYGKIYVNIDEHSLWWVPISILLAIILHDTYFYWMHRVLHHRSLYKMFHRVHHKSVNPSPLASYSFNFTEGILEAMVIPLVVFLVPMHPIALIIFALLAYSYNVYGHLGYELVPRWFRKSIFFGIMVTSVHHNLHHHKFIGNYGYYFRFWDRLMGTEHPDYVRTFDEIQQKRFGTNAYQNKKNISK